MRDVDDGDAPRGEDTNSNILMRNIVYWNNSRLWNEERWPNWRMVLDFNLYYDASGKPLAPKAVLFVSDLPKTRNAKVMRRMIRAAYLGQEPGDTSSLVNPEAVEESFSREPGTPTFPGLHPVRNPGAHSSRVSGAKSSSTSTFREERPCSQWYCKNVSNVLRFFTCGSSRDR